METVNNRESVHQDNMLSAAKLILCFCHSKVESFVKSGQYSINISELGVETLYCNILHMAMLHDLQPHTVTQKNVLNATFRGTTVCHWARTFLRLTYTVPTDCKSPDYSMCVTFRTFHDPTNH